VDTTEAQTQLAQRPGDGPPGQAAAEGVNDAKSDPAIV
jgi:hypothetical protein